MTVIIPVKTYVHGAHAYENRRWIHDVTLKRTKRAWEVGRPSLTIKEAMKRAIEVASR